MRLLFVHQNFPAQFKHLAPALATQHEVVAFTMQKNMPADWQGVRLISYQAVRGSTPTVHPWVGDFETKIIRAEAAFNAAIELRDSGFSPDLIIAHPAWGESLFLKDVWPKAKLAVYCEFFYHASGADVGFDKEFYATAPADVCRLRLKNLNNFLHFNLVDAGIAPTRWQASTFPKSFRSKITVIHEGIDTTIIAPNEQISLNLNGDNGSITLSRDDEIITFISRRLEPYRGYHIFMRALPELLRRRPNARVLIVGDDAVGYGAPPPNGTWKAIFLNEVIQQLDMNRVHFLGHVPYELLIPLLQLSRVHVYLTYPFVLSWSLLEAMSAGCAIVASDTRPLHEAIRHDETGRLVNFFDTQALTEEVCYLLDNPEKRATLGANARAFAQATYDLKTICLPKQLAWVESLLA
ncbi:MAG: glycosyltransferase [Methylococcales bacterium]|nr:glycosyltransferase [Methylococcales bacterium]